MFFTELFKCRRIKYKIILLFAVIFILPLTFLMMISLNRISDVAQQDLKRNTGYALSLYRTALEDQLDTLRIRAKTVADFDLYNISTSGFTAATTLPVMQYELVRSGLDYIALIQDKSIILLEEGATPSEMLSRVVIPAMCHSSLTANLYILGDEAWFFAAARLTKLKTPETRHILFAQKMSRDFGDKLKRLTGAEYTLIYNNKQIVTTKMDVYTRRETGVNILKDGNSGTINIMGKSHYFIREAALASKISDEIKVEIAMPDSEYKRLEKSMKGDFFVFAVIGVLLALATGSMLSWDIANPINWLARLTTKVAAGDLNVSSAIERYDEIGILDKNFKEMIISIKTERELKENRMSELNTLFAISNAVNYFTDSEELLKFVLTHAIEVLDAERGSIMLLDDQTDELIIKVASGGRYRAFTSPPVKLGQGICGIVASEGKGIICNDGFKDTRFSNFDSLMPVEDIITLICAPLKFKEGTIGVINIVNKRGGGMFSDTELSLLNLIASQAAVTIENNKLYELSITDGMTRLYVHRYFQARLSEELLRARRYGLSLSLIMIDIDNFKKFNDNYGHQVGDKVLQKVAQTIKETVRTGVDIPCRYGGEEMSVILPETRDDEALFTAERIRERISEIRVPHPSGDLKITVSIGVASYPIHSHDRESLIKVADKALYESKANGKNRSTLAEGKNINE